MRVNCINQCLLHHVLTAIFWAPTVACLVLVVSVLLAKMQWHAQILGMRINLLEIGDGMECKSSLSAKVGYHWLLMHVLRSVITIYGLLVILLASAKIFSYEYV